ncbi:MAG: hypothetical protein KGR25_11185, partial [Chloroflexi bacterium]|nr:hypothetical protein [Chloroflexota bacterium]
MSERFRSRRAILTGMSGAIAGLVAVACGGEAAPAAPAPKAEPTKAPAAAAPTAAPAAAAPTVAPTAAAQSGGAKTLPAASISWET